MTVSTEIDVSPPRLLEYLETRVEAMVELLAALARIESPTDVPGSHGPVRELLRERWEGMGYRTRQIPGSTTGGQLLFVPEDRTRHRPLQLMVGHLDTVWPLGTLEHMPVVRRDGTLKGPGVFDMKGGLVQMIFAVEALRALDAPLPATPVVFVNSDEEIGSPESRKEVRRLARAASRAFILEPCMGPRGLIKTARKGVGRFVVSIVGTAAHAGLDPEAGVSAILELSHVIQALDALNDRERGLTVNVGVIEGGTRPNVIAANSRAVVDVRALTVEDAEEATSAIQGLAAVVPGTRLAVTGGFQVPPLERTPRNQVLWQQARSLGRAMGLELDEVTAGGGSDGNTTSQHTATLDGLGPRGDGAHAEREHIVIDSLAERTALLAALLAAPLERPREE